MFSPIISKKAGKKFNLIDSSTDSQLYQAFFMGGEKRKVPLVYQDLVFTFKLIQQILLSYEVGLENQFNIPGRGGK